MFAEDMTDEQFTETVERVMRANPLAWEQCEHDARDFMSRAGITWRDPRTPDNWHDALESACEAIYWEAWREYESESTEHAGATVEVLAVPSWNEGAGLEPYRVRVLLEDRNARGYVMAHVHGDDMARLFGDAMKASRTSEASPSMVYVVTDDHVEFFDMLNGTRAICPAVYDATGAHTNYYDMAALGAMWTIEGN